MPSLIDNATPDMAELRQRYKIPRGTASCWAHSGSANHAKRTDVILRAIAALGRKDIIYLAAGEMGENFHRQTPHAELGDLVRITGYVDAKEFNRLLHLIDVGIDEIKLWARVPSQPAGFGLRANHVISNFGWFAEIPDGCAARSTPRRMNTRSRRCLSELIVDEQLRRNVGERACRYIRENHGVEQAAGAYVEFVGQVRDFERRRRVEYAIVDETGRAMAELGVGDDDDRLIDQHCAGNRRPVQARASVDTGVQ